MKNRKIHILYVLDILSFGSGVSAVVMNYLRHIDTCYFAVDVAVHKTGDSLLEQELETKGFRVFHLPNITLVSWALYKKEMRHLLKQGHYDIVHGHIANAAFLYMTAAKILGVPHRIQHSHNTHGADHPLKKLRNYVLESGIPRWANHYFACSDLAAEYLFGNHVKKEDIVILPNAIDTQKFRWQPELGIQLRTQLGISPNTTCIGHIGRLVPQKNHVFLLDIFKHYHNKNRNSLLLLAGEGPLQEELQKQTKQYGLQDSVRFLGLLPNTAALYQLFDIFLLPSLFEGLPVVGVEAQCAGLPCLFSDTITPSAKLLSQTVFLPLKNPENWSDTIIQILQKTKRKDQSNAVATAGYDIAKQVATLQKLYQKIVTIE